MLGAPGRHATDASVQRQHCALRTPNSVAFSEASGIGLPQRLVHLAAVCVPVAIAGVRVATGRLNLLLLRADAQAAVASVAQMHHIDLKVPSATVSAAAALGRPVATCGGDGELVGLHFNCLGPARFGDLRQRKVACIACALTGWTAWWLCAE